jgi:acyl-coenzyme A thioesterase PaaI-like protein
MNNTLFSNRLTRSLEKLQRAPARLRPWLLSRTLGKVVPFVGTAGLEFLKLEPGRVEIHIDNRKHVQNHIHGVHAAAMALLAETATGFVVGMSIPDDKLPLMKSMKIDYNRRAQDGLTAVARLTGEQIRQIQTAEKGEVTVSVHVKDASRAEPIQCEMVWAWVPMKK